MICVGELSKGAGQGRRVSYSFAACVWVPVWLLFGSCLVPIVSIVLGWRLVPVVPIISMAPGWFLAVFVVPVVRWHFEHQSH